MGLYLYRNLWTGLTIYNLLTSYPILAFHEKSAISLTIYRKFVQCPELTDEPETFLSSGLIMVTLRKIILPLTYSLNFPALPWGLWERFPHLLPQQVSTRSTSISLGYRKDLASVMSALASGFRFRECFLN